jgi:hypothetical protein
MVSISLIIKYFVLFFAVFDALRSLSLPGTVAPSDDFTITDVPPGVNETPRIQ